MKIVGYLLRSLVRFRPLRPYNGAPRVSRWAALTLHLLPVNRSARAKNISRKIPTRNGDYGYGTDVVTSGRHRRGATFAGAPTFHVFIDSRTRADVRARDVAGVRAPPHPVIVVPLRRGENATAATSSATYRSSVTSARVPDAAVSRRPSNRRCSLSTSFVGRPSAVRVTQMCEKRARNN